MPDDDRSEAKVAAPEARGARAGRWCWPLVAAASRADAAVVEALCRAIAASSVGDR